MQGSCEAVIPGWYVSTRPQMRNCASGNLAPQDSGFDASHRPGMTGLCCMPSNLIREREGLAPAVFADLAFDHLAGVRPFEQRAQAAAVDAVRRVLILR